VLRSAKDDNANCRPPFLKEFVSGNKIAPTSEISRLRRSRQRSGDRSVGSGNFARQCVRPSCGTSNRRSFPAFQALFCRRLRPFERGMQSPRAL